VYSCTLAWPLVSVIEAVFKCISGVGEIRGQCVSQM
jgi:hypothetical protein